MPGGPEKRDLAEGTYSQVQAQGCVVLPQHGTEGNERENLLWRRVAIIFTRYLTRAAAASSANRICCASASMEDGATRYALSTPSKAAAMDPASSKSPITIDAEVSPSLATSCLWRIIARRAKARS